MTDFKGTPGPWQLSSESPTRHAEAWRAAAESCRQQFPDDLDRYRYYADRAEQLERQSEQ